jgi:hypothetical protein
MKPTREQVVEWAEQSGHRLGPAMELELTRFAALAYAAGQANATPHEVADRVESVAIALDRHFSYERGLDPYIDALNKLAADIRGADPSHRVAIQKIEESKNKGGAA